MVYREKRRKLAPIRPNTPVGAITTRSRVPFIRVIATHKGARLRTWFYGGPKGEWALEAKPGTPAVNQRTVNAAAAFTISHGAPPNTLSRIKQIMSKAGYLIQIK